MVSIQILVARCPETRPSPFLRHLHSLHRTRKHALEGIVQSLSVRGQDGVDGPVIECGRLDWLARAKGPPPDSSVHACSEQELLIRVNCDSLEQRFVDRLLGT